MTKNNEKKSKEPKGLFDGLDNTAFKPNIVSENKKPKINYVDQLKVEYTRRSYDITKYNLQRLGMYKAMTGKNFSEIVNDAVTDYLDNKGIKIMDEHK